MCIRDRGIVIDALITTRILVQFIGQVFAIVLLRRRMPDLPRPYKVWLYPLPNLLALIGWIFIFSTTDWPIIVLGLGTLLLGTLAFLSWSWYTKRWPFAKSSPDVDGREGFAQTVGEADE